MFSPSPQIRSKDVHDSGENMCFYVFLWRIYHQYTMDSWYILRMKIKTVGWPHFLDRQSHTKVFLHCNCSTIWDLDDHNPTKGSANRIVVLPPRCASVSCGKSRPKSDPSVRVFESEKYWKIFKIRFGVAKMFPFLSTFPSKNHVEIFNSKPSTWECLLGGHRCGPSARWIEHLDLLSRSNAVEEREFPFGNGW